MDWSNSRGKLSALVEMATLIRTLAPVPREQLHLYFTNGRT